MRIFWGVAVGAALGGLSRYYLTIFIQHRAGADFPVATLVINVTGSLLLGFIWRYALQSNAISEAMRLTLATGFCGGYTTFSTFTYETAVLLQDGEFARAGTYVGASVLIALIGVFVGFAAAQRLLAWQHGG